MTCKDLKITTLPGTASCRCGWSQHCESMDHGFDETERHAKEKHPANYYDLSWKWQVDKKERAPNRAGINENPIIDINVPDDEDAGINTRIWGDAESVCFDTTDHYGNEIGDGIDLSWPEIFEAVKAWVSK